MIGESDPAPRLTVAGPLWPEPAHAESQTPSQARRSGSGPPLGDAGRTARHRRRRRCRGGRTVTEATGCTST